MNRTFVIHYKQEALGADAPKEKATVKGQSSVRACRALAERLGSLTIFMVHEVRTEPAR